MKILRTLVLTLTLCFAFSPRQAKAIVGLATGNPVVTWVGISVMGGGGLIVAGGAALAHINSQDINSGYLLLGGLIYGVPVAAFGLIILDDKKSGTVEFKKLDKKNLGKLKLSNDELQAYNSNVVEFNAMAEEIQADVATRFKGQKLNKSLKSAIKKEVENGWVSYLKEMKTPALAQSALKKIRQAK